MDFFEPQTPQQKRYKPLSIGLYLFLAVVLTGVALSLSAVFHRSAPAPVQTVRLTFPEGITNTDMAAIVREKIPTFDQQAFLAATATIQGRVFPDTYFVYPSITPTALVAKMTSTFERKAGPLLAQGYKSYTENQILTMASLVQKEAANADDAPVIAGILWKRIEMGMALQVDASPITYSQKGLPASPINNPGLVALEATVNPTASAYLYYLHDKSGMIHVASSYAEHLKNVKKYLK